MQRWQCTIHNGTLKPLKALFDQVRNRYQGLCFKKRISNVVVLQNWQLCISTGRKSYKNYQNYHFLTRKNGCFLHIFDQNRGSLKIALTVPLNQNNLHTKTIMKSSLKIPMFIETLCATQETFKPMSGK